MGLLELEWTIMMDPGRIWLSGGRSWFIQGHALANRSFFPGMHNYQAVISSICQGHETPRLPFLTRLVRPTPYTAICLAIAR